MKILYFTTACNMEQYESLIKDMKVKPSTASMTFESSLLRGFNENNADISVITFPILPAFPNSNILLWKKKEELLENGYKTKWLPAINIAGLKQFCMHIESRKAIIKWLNDNRNEEKAILIYSIYKPIVNNIIDLCNRYSARSYAIIADLPRDMYNNKKISIVKKLLSNGYVKKAQRLQGSFDGYIYLTERMKEIINPTAPYIIMEGLYSESSNQDLISYNEESKQNNVIMYAGALNEKYGIKNLLEAFNLLTMDAQLWIFGSGDFENDIKKYAAKNPKIIFWGRLTRDEILSFEKKASLLVNVRNNGDDFTKYSFPSKTIEYMASGTPLLTTKLDGIPKEYYDYCYSIENNDVQSIHKSLNDILSLPLYKRNELGRKARQYIIEHKNSMAQAKRILAFIENKGKRNRDE